MSAIYVCWAVSAVLLAALAVALGAAIGRGWLGILIDHRGRYSLSQLQLVTWTLVLVPIIAGVALGRLFGGAAGGAFAFTIPDHLLIVMGMSVASLAMAATVKTAKDGDHPDRVAASDEHDRARIAQIFLVEEGELADQIVDVTKFQNFWITVVIVVTWVGAFVAFLRSTPGVDGVTALPAFSDTALVLLAISHAGYLGGKLPTPRGTPAGLTLQMKRTGAVPGAAPALPASRVTYQPRNP